MNIHTITSVKRPVSPTILVLLCWVMLSGCNPYIDANVPEPIRLRIEPRLGNAYLLYRPSSYDAKASWPLVIVCHSSFPDSPNRQIRRWTEQAEEYGFLIAVPALVGTKKGGRLKPDKQLLLQRDDEQRILATIRNVQAAHDVSNDRIFLCGFEGGARAALHTGLRYPDLIRAIALLRPRFDEACMIDVVERVDASQPVCIASEVSDIIKGKPAGRCVDWLTAQGGDVHAVTIGPGAGADVERAISFIERTIRTRPWIRIETSSRRAEDPLEVRFALRSTIKPVSQQWEFGDGDASPVATPIHTYRTAGTYRVLVTVHDTDGHAHRRTMNIEVPPQSDIPGEL